MAQSTIEGGRTKGSRDHRNFFQVTESPKPKGRKWDQAPPRSAPEHRKPSQLKIDQHRLDEGHGGWFGEYRRHSEAARQGQDHRERHLPVNVKPQERPGDVHEPHIIGTRGSRDRIFIIGITADGIDIGMDRPIDNMGEALKEAQALAKAPNMMSYPGQVRGHVGAIYAHNYSEARTKLWAYAKRMKWVPPGTKMKNGG